jgi:hypothetical protein
MMNVVARLKSLPPSERATIIWMQTPPMGFQFGHQGLARNNFVIDAVHSWLLPQLRQLGVTIIPYFEIAWPRQTETACNIHYMCAKKGANNSVRMLASPVGDMVLRVILHTLRHA